MWLAGTRNGPEGRLAPNITPDRETGIGGWSAGDIVQLLKSGRKPDFDNVEGAMAEAIDDGLRYLSDEDLAAITEYLLALEPVRNRIEARR